jgi:gas vesicle protein
MNTRLRGDEGGVNDTEMPTRGRKLTKLFKEKLQPENSLLRFIIAEYVLIHKMEGSKSLNENISDIARISEYIESMKKIEYC